ncbi:MAG: Omp28-related outer membrane protein [candidate division Zixibacteria bacterium]|nr:Omp28-related outer membrane protein [candidate division Zixibacteria bacterium]
MFEQYHEQISIIRYHYGGGDPFYNFNPTECYDRVYYYPPDNGAYFPHGLIDGIIDGEWLYETWGDLVEQRLQIESPLKIELAGVWEDYPVQLQLDIQLTATDSIDYTELRLHCVLVESELIHGAETFHQVMRDMIPNADGEQFGISFGESLHFSKEVEIYPELVADNCDIVAFVQDSTSYDILQTNRISVNQIHTGIEDERDFQMPDRVSLDNYPNPFNSSTVIRFELAEKSEVQLLVYNLVGQKVADILHDIYQPGSYNVKWDAKNQPSGMYFYKMKVNNRDFIRKAVLIK